MGRPPGRRHISVAGSVPNEVDLSAATFENVNMSKTRMHDINLSDLDPSAAQFAAPGSNTSGLPRPAGKQARQRPVTFEDAMLG